MTKSLYDRIWRREAGGVSTAANIRGLYGSKEWVGDLDIVNELGGHTGCVNALSWSRSGRLLASGSDDFHLNIYSYQPESSTAPFALNTSVFTGHTGNIFSVAFMPHSNDRTLVTTAGDSQVRVFDIEHSSSRNAAQSEPLAFSTQARSQSLNQFFGNVRSLGVGNTNARIYRSHADRVKRIVTESSPHLFLTCSEDGEVRQWDLRLPSSAYPKPRGGLLYMTNRAGQHHDDSNVPPPLISYKRHRLDLNTISCSPSQPHYIALGGAHLHCFLHDRRMLGRDISAERGDPGASPIPGGGRDDDEMMGKATRCVRRFAPNGKERTKSRYKGHITACKISNANPNEMIVSWSGDHIYSFDLVRGPDALDAHQETRTTLRGKSGSRRRRTSKARKRKRQTATSLSSQSSGGRRRSRRNETLAQEDGQLALRVRYGNGETENISIPSLLHEGVTASSATSAGMMEHARYSVLNEAQRQSLRIAKGLVKLRKAMFSLDPSVREVGAAMPFRDAFSSVLMIALTFLPQMEQVMRTWGYPINPTPEIVRFQQTLRRHRESAYRFVQAAGTIAKALGGDIQDFGVDDALERFDQIGPAPGEDNVIIEKEQFGYDFLKAIVLFIEGGRSALLSGFKCSSASRRNRDRFPLPQNALDGAIETILLPYLSDLAGDVPVVNVDSSRFEHDSTRILFPTQRAAVAAFGEALKIDMSNGIEGRFVVGSNGSGNGNINGGSSGTSFRAIEPSRSTRFWLLEVGRGILMETGTDINFEYVNRAFGGLNATIEDSTDESGEEMEVERSQDDAEANAEEESIHDISFTINGDPGHHRRPAFAESWTPNMSTQTASEEDDYHGTSLINSGGTDETDETDDTEDDEDDNDDDDDDDGSEDSSESDVAERLFRSYGFERSAREEEVEKDVPVSSHTRIYRGHCNVKTVKDCNFFGLNDEYVVSGSDSGHLFIWERDTCKLVNILKGDDEVVNVVQGHPYEPIIAASGIDDTIKIFSPDQRAQDDARRGINILDPNNPVNTLGPSFGGLKSAKCMHDSYRIMSENDVQRQGGMSDAFVTRHMLAQFAATVRDQQGGVVPGEHARIVLDENCNIPGKVSRSIVDAEAH
ncbi:WD40 repeat-like protein [Aspergillus heterothallicus]